MDSDTMDSTPTFFLSQAILTPRWRGVVFHTLACGPGVSSDTVNHSKSVRNHFTVESVIKNGKKTK